MAKEKFLIIATPISDDCFGRFSETSNRAAIEAGTSDTEDAYSWIEQSFEIQLIRWREATHICSFTPSARYEWLANFFVGEPNEAWSHDGDPDGLERENGGEQGGYGTYHDDYDPRFIVRSFIVDSMKDLDEPMRAPRRKRLSDRGEADERYLDAIWNRAIEVAQEIGKNSDYSDAPILNVWTYRKWEAENREKVRRASCEQSKRPISWTVDLLAPAMEAAARAAYPNHF